MESKDITSAGLKLTVAWYLDHMDWLERLSNNPELQEWMRINYSGRRIEK